MNEAWFGHVERMEGKRLPNAALHGHVRGERSRGRQRKRWMYNVRDDLDNQSINQYSFYYQQKTTADTAATEVLRQECDHYCPGRKLEWLIIMEE